MEEKAQAFGTLVLMQNPLFQSFHQTQNADTALQVFITATLLL